MSLSPLADPLTSALFLHHRERAPRKLLARLVPVPIPGTEKSESPNFEAMKARVRIKSSNVVHLPTPAVIEAAKPNHPSIDLITDEVCRFYKVTRVNLMSKQQDRAVSRPRQIAIYLARELAGSTWPDLARYFKRDHSTAGHAIQRVSDLVKKDDRIRDEVDVLTLRILDAMRAAA